MAKLVGVYDEEEEIILGRRQLPLNVYDNRVVSLISIVFPLVSFKLSPLKALASLNNDHLTDFFLCM